MNKILNRFLEDPKDYTSESNKFFKKNYFLSGNFHNKASKGNLNISKNDNQVTITSPIISELSLNTTINITNNSSANATSNSSYVLNGNNKNSSLIRMKKNNKTENSINGEKKLGKKIEINKCKNLENEQLINKPYMNKTFIKKKDKVGNKENISFFQNLQEKKNKSKYF